MKFLVAHNIDAKSLERLRSVSSEVEVIVAKIREDAVARGLMQTLSPFAISEHI